MNRKNRLSRANFSCLEQRILLSASELTTEQANQQQRARQAAEAEQARSATEAENARMRAAQSGERQKAVTQPSSSTAADSTARQPVTTAAPTRQPDTAMATSNGQLVATDSSPRQAVATTPTTGSPSLVSTDQGRVTQTDVRLPGGAVARVQDSSSDVVSTPNNDGYYRTGELRRDPAYYEGDPLKEFKKGETAGATAGRLHNPYRDDGSGAAPHQQTNVETGYYSEGPYHTLEDGSTALGRQGGAYIQNDSDVNVLVAQGLLPGNEQPGQAITPVKKGQRVQAPRPAPENDGERNGGQPETYASVGNIDPTDAIGFRYSNARPGDNGNLSDFGTPQYAYKTDVAGNDGEIHASLGTNEGYDPSLSQDPGYGVTLHGINSQGQKKDLVGVVFIERNDANTATATLVGKEEALPKSGADEVNLTYSQQQNDGDEFLYTFVTTEDAKSIADAHANLPGYTRATHVHRSVPVA